MSARKSASETHENPGDCRPPHVQRITSAEGLELKPLSHSNAAELEQKLALIPKWSGRCLGGFSHSQALLQAQISFTVVTSPHTACKPYIIQTSRFPRSNSLSITYLLQRRRWNRVGIWIPSQRLHEFSHLLGRQISLHLPKAHSFHLSDMVQYQEVIVAVMGVTRCGKSSFVNLLLGEQKAIVGHSLQAREYQVQGPWNTHQTLNRDINSRGLPSHLQIRQIFNSRHSRIRRHEQI